MLADSDVTRQLRNTQHQQQEDFKDTRQRHRHSNHSLRRAILNFAKFVIETAFLDKDTIRQPQLVFSLDVEDGDIANISRSNFSATKKHMTIETQSLGPSSNASVKSLAMRDCLLSFQVLVHIF